MKKTVFIISTVMIMLLVSRFVIRIIDATVQIDGDMIILIAFLLIINFVIGFLSFKIYEKVK